MSSDSSQLITRAPYLMASMTFDGRLTSANPAWSKATTRTESDLLGQDFFALLKAPDEARTIVREAIEKKSTSLEQRFCLPKAEGDACYLWTFEFDYESGTCYVFARDITTKLQTESRLKEQSELFKSFVSNIPGAISRFVLRTDGSICFEYMSEGARELLEREPSDLVGVPTEKLELFSPKDLPGLITETFESAASLTPFRWEGRLNLPSGREKWIEIASRPARRDDGSIAWDGVMLDITGKRNAERSLERERAKSIGAAKMATLGEMTAGLAHEINNPLAIIQGKAEQLEEMVKRTATDPEKVAAHAQKISVMAQRIGKIIRGLRIFARDAKDDPYESKTIKSLLDETFELCQTRFKNHSVSLTFEGSEETIRCRSVQISQVLLNLLNNAFDAIHETEKPWVKVGCEETEHEIIIRVTDSGPGISEALADRIMQPFFTTKELGKGTGLGLSISKDIVENHGGTLTLDRGAANTSFVIRLPKAKPQAAQPALKAA